MLYEKYNTKWIQSWGSTNFVPHISYFINKNNTSRVFNLYLLNLSMLETKIKKHGKIKWLSLTNINKVLKTDITF